MSYEYTDYDFIAKVIFSGEEESGKTALLEVVQNNYFPNKYDPTKGIEFGSKLCIVHNKTLKLQIWDIAGKIPSGPKIKNYCKGAHIVCLMWDASILDALGSLKARYEYVKEFCPADTKFIFVRTKIDNDKEKAVALATIKEQHAQIKAFAGDVPILEVSAKTRVNVNTFLTTVAEIVFSIHQKKEKEVKKSLRPAVGFFAKRYERMKHSRTCREKNLTGSFFNTREQWLKLHLASIEPDCRTARRIRDELYHYDVSLSPAEKHKYAPVIELLKELDVDERHKGYKFLIFFTPECFSKKIIAERNRKFREVILDVAFRLFEFIEKLEKSPDLGKIPSAQELYGERKVEQIPRKIRKMLENYYPVFGKEHRVGLN